MREFKKGDKKSICKISRADNERVFVIIDVEITAVNQTVTDGIVSDTWYNWKAVNPEIDQLIMSRACPPEQYFYESKQEIMQKIMTEGVILVTE